MYQQEKDSYTLVNAISFLREFVFEKSIDAWKMVDEIKQSMNPQTLDKINRAIKALDNRDSSTTISIQKLQNMRQERLGLL